MLCWEWLARVWRERWLALAGRNHQMGFKKPLIIPYERILGLGAYWPGFSGGQRKMCRLWTPGFLVYHSWRCTVQLWVFLLRCWHWASVLWWYLVCWYCEHLEAKHERSTASDHHRLACVSSLIVSKCVDYFCWWHLQSDRKPPVDHCNSDLRSTRPLVEQEVMLPCMFFGNEPPKGAIKLDVTSATT